MLATWNKKKYKTTCDVDNEAPNIHGCTMHLDVIEVFYLPTDAQYRVALKEY